MMRAWRALTALPPGLLIAAMAGCVSLSYEDPQTDATSIAAESSSSPSPSGPGSSRDGALDPLPTSTPTSTPDPASVASTNRSTPTRARIDQRKTEAKNEEPQRSWRELSRLARERTQEGKLDEANELLAQAALQLADRRPTNTRRRTVFGLRARLAQDLATNGQIEEADLLADELFEQVRREPTLGDTALVSLARATAERRTAAAREAGRDVSPLPLLALAFETARSDTADRDRLGLGFQVSGLALRAGDLDLARRAIDQAILDAQVVAPGDRLQAAALKVYKARIALAQRDLDTALAAARAAMTSFEEIKANASSRGVAETTLAQVLAEKGEIDRGLELARVAYARLSGSEALVVHARRQIIAGLARVERLAGEVQVAGSHYREALSDPPDGSSLDADLIHTIKAALSELETTAATPANR
jgi:tetratricopeptide (TPR) repeat protein